MNSIKGYARKLLAIGVTIAISQAYAYAGFARAASAGLDDAAARATIRQGRLITTGGKSIKVNGVKATTGETIFSGQQLQTPSGIGAIVQLGQSGHVNVAPSTNATLTFEDGQTNIALTSGCVSLTTNKGVTGAVEVRGIIETTDAETGGTLDVCTNATPGGLPVIGHGEGNPAATAGTQQPDTDDDDDDDDGGAIWGMSTGAAGALAAGIVGAFALISWKVISDSEAPAVGPCTPGQIDPSTGLPTVCT